MSDQIVRIGQDLHYRLKVAAAIAKMTIREMAETAICSYLDNLEGNSLFPENSKTGPGNGKTGNGEE